MKKFKSILVACAFAASVHCPAHAEDTYNFFFQKAPGPVTVNQGGGSAPASPAPVVASPALASEPSKPEAPLAATRAILANSVEEQGGTNRWRFSAGYTMGNKLESSPSFGQKVSQYSLGLQFNPLEALGIQAEAFMIRNPNMPPRGAWGEEISTDVSGSPFDGSLSLVVTPLRSRKSSSFQLAFSALGGVTTVPKLRLDFSNYSLGFRYDHDRSLFYGARIEGELWKTVSLQASVRRIGGNVDETLGDLSVAYLF
jgi:hypothetical protein